MTEEVQPNFQRVAVNLQQRFAEKVANYEGEIAMMREQFESELEALRAEVARLKEENDEPVQPKKSK